MLFWKFFLDNKSTKVTSPTTQRRPISIVITPESGNPSQSMITPTGDRPCSNSFNSPRSSNNIDVEDDEAVLTKRSQVSLLDIHKLSSLLAMELCPFLVNTLCTTS